MINEIAVSIALLAIAVTLGVYLFAMKTTELTTAINNLTTATTGLSDSVDKAVTALGNQGAPSTPDSDIVPLITAIDARTTEINAAKARLDAALNPPTV
jgi:hypothetical protein